MFNLRDAPVSMSVNPNLEDLSVVIQKLRREISACILQW